jgi:succinate dehydrogenase / fumarate reductase membrane anchor subunit
MALLGLWFAVSLIGMDLSQRGELIEWASGTFNTVMLVLLVTVAAYHSHLGTRVVIEDYSRGWARVAGLVVVQFVHVVLAGVGIVAVLRLGSGG